jgi:hypothetical protein
MCYGGSLMLPANIGMINLSVLTTTSQFVMPVCSLTFCCLDVLRWYSLVLPANFRMIIFISSDIKPLLFNDKLYMFIYLTFLRPTRCVALSSIFFSPESNTVLMCFTWELTLSTILQLGLHPEFENSRCLFIVRTDGEQVDFSFWKCIKGLIREKYPLYADSFILRHFRRRQDYWN